jgi:hypothetical protein
MVHFEHTVKISDSKFQTQLFREIRDRLIFLYKYAYKFFKISIYFQIKEKFDENSRWSFFKYITNKSMSKKFNIYRKKVLKPFQFILKITKTKKNLNFKAH